MSGAKALEIGDTDERHTGRGNPEDEMECRFCKKYS